MAKDTNDELILQDIKNAYRKLKHFVYYDNSDLLLRIDLAKFESDGDIEKKFSTLSKSILAYYETGTINESLEKLIQDIDYWAIPKKINDPRGEKVEEEKDQANYNILTNTVFSSEIRIEKIFYLINAPIEIHIISVYWILKEGYKLEKELKQSPPYGFKLHLSDNGEVVNGLKLFKPYFKEYQKWRDLSIKKAKELIKNGQNTCIVGLDVKNYFDSIKLDFKSLELKKDESSTKEDNSRNTLTSLLEKIHIAYYKKRQVQNSEIVLDGPLGLPIGLLSSAVLGNWFLSDFDKKAINKLRPFYYGRYVDDILMVISAPSFDCKNQDELSENLFNEFFLKNELLKKESDDPLSYLIKGKGLHIQTEKVSLMYFDSTQSMALLDKFESDLRQRSSEFRFLPEEEKPELEFHQAAHSLSYSGTKSKLRNIKDFSADKFGMSKFLANKIFSSLQADIVKDSLTVSQLNLYFKNHRLIDFYKLWEKVLTYFISTNQTYGIEVFIKNLKEALIFIKINKIDLREESNKSEKTDQLLLRKEESKIKEWLKEQAIAALSMALSLNPRLIGEKTTLHKLVKELGFDPMKIVGNTKAIRESNLVRHKYVFYPLLNYTELNLKYQVSLVDKATPLLNKKGKSHGGNNYEIADSKFKYSPRFVHFHEVVLYVIYKRLYNFNNEENDLCDERVVNLFGLDKSDGNSQNYLNEAFKVFYKINYSRSKSLSQEENKNLENIKKQYFNLDPNIVKNPVHLSEIKVDGLKKFKTLKVALANIMVHPENMKASYLEKPIISKGRKKEINSLLNQVIEESEQRKVDLLVLPESSIPYKWLNWLCEHAKNETLAMAFGLEHWIVNNIAYNLIVSLLPTKIKVKGIEGQEDGSFNALIPIIRIKNHYSPGEVKELKGYRYTIPKVSPSRYNLIIWKGLHFSVFNCFELTNILHRSMFRSKVDFLIACEFNRDVNYFSNIVETVTRDIHCYFIQSNNSKFGDNRITKPSRTVEKDLLKIKGGKNTTILVDIIDVNQLRYFQLKEHNLQLDDKQFKPTPPGFDIDEVKKRIGLKINS